MAKKKTAFHKKHIPTKWGIIIITIAAFILTIFVASQYNSPQNIFSNASADKGKIYSTVYPDKCLTAPAKKGRVTIQTCKDGDSNQVWERSGGIVDRIYKNNSLCLETENMKTASGTFVTVGDCGDGKNKAERWAEIDETQNNNNNGGVLKLHGINECLTGDKYQVNIGNDVKLLPCQKSYNSQAWHFLQASGNGNGGSGSGGGGTGSGGGSYIGTACSTPQGSGTCQSTGNPPSGTGHFVPGYCPGPSNIECWVHGTSGGGGGGGGGQCGQNSYPVKGGCVCDSGYGFTTGNNCARCGANTTISESTGACICKSGYTGNPYYGCTATGPCSSYGGGYYFCKTNNKCIPQSSSCPRCAPGLYFCSTTNSCVYGSCPEPKCQAGFVYCPSIKSCRYGGCP